MITELEITGFRGFNNFSLHDLGRVNLLTGSNNSGKTSVLEAIQCFAAQGSLLPIYSITKRRGEYICSDFQTKDSDLEMDICRLFYGYKMEAGSQFIIRGKHNGVTDTVQAAISKISEQVKLFGEDDEFISRYILTMEGYSLPNPMKIHLSNQGGLSYNRLLRPSMYTRGQLKETGINRPSMYTRGQLKETGKVLFISTVSLPVGEIVGLFEDIVLSPEEQLVIESMKIIEPAIERIASIGSERRGGIVVKCRDIEQRIPIGSMGDGIWRLLGITLALVKAEGGILLIDEIDTGFHFTIMENMWKLITKTAERLNVQVFATTHNSDCWTSLAAVLVDKDGINDKITIQRIEKNKKQAVSFTEEEIIIAAEREIEVR
ncbi:MAG: AAA family ATPase [Gammaproteobacteria bacterium]|nr:AAA family ATPase [Gammaproteobacteria bacterium]